MDEAIDLALKELGATRDDVDIEVVSRGRTGFLGIGAEPARVRVRRKGAPIEEPPARGAPVASRGGTIVAAPGTETPSAQDAMDVVRKLLAASGAKVTVSLRTPKDADSGGPIIDIEGEDSGLLIGRRGETLQATQFLVNLMVNRRAKEPMRVTLDVERYRERRQQALRDMALKVASRVAQTGRPISLEPMPAAERRIVHIALANHTQVVTQSVGVGGNRKVSILPRRGGAGAGSAGGPVGPAGRGLPREKSDEDDEE